MTLNRVIGLTADARAGINAASMQGLHGELGSAFHGHPTLSARGKLAPPRQ